MDPQKPYTRLPLEVIHELYQVIEGHPGLTLWDLMRLTGWSQGKIHRRLIALECSPFLVYEDAQGHLYPF